MHAGSWSYTKPLDKVEGTLEKEMPFENQTSDERPVGVVRA